MTTETLTVVIRGRNLEPLRQLVAEGQLRYLRVFDAQREKPPAEGEAAEAVIESIRLLPESSAAEEIEKLKNFKDALKKSGLGTGSK
jgi:hypothetical protein